jgi:hypothetical protein
MYQILILWWPTAAQETYLLLIQLAMRIIGAGWGRTGTASVKMALERLGAGPCLHMTEMWSHPKLAAAWNRYRKGEPVDWQAELAGWNATVDWPGATIWRELAMLWPSAPILLTVRDPRSWYESVRSTIHPATEPHLDIGPAEVRELMTRTLWDDCFGGWQRALDPDWAMAAFEAHNQSVRLACPVGRLIEWQASDGWEPLCVALGVDIPEEPFPHLNDRGSWRR